MEELPLSGSFTIAFALLAAGYITWSVAKKTESGTLRRNGMAGIRTKATLASDEAWEAAHTAAAPAMRAAAAFCVLTGLGVLATSSKGGLAVLVVIVGLALLGGAMTKAMMAANKAARATIAADIAG